MKFTPFNDPYSTILYSKYRKKFNIEHPGYILGSDPSKPQNTRVKSYFEAKTKREHIIATQES